MNDPVEFIKDYTERILSDNLLFSLVFGSYAYERRTNNDIDIIFVTKDEMDNNTREELIREYFNLHQTFGLNADRRWPGEYITERQLVQSQNGWGFSFRNGKVDILEIKDGSEWNDFNDYRHHLTAVGGPTLFVSGDERLASDHKKRCIRTIATVVILHNSLQNFTLESLVNMTIGAGKIFLGFSDVRSVKNYLSLQFNEILEDLKENGKIGSNGSVRTILDRSFIFEIEKSIKDYNEKYVR